MPDDVFDHHDRSVHDDPEVNRAHRNQVGRIAANHHHDEREHQRERDREGHHQRGAQMTEERQQNERHQDHSLDQRVGDRVGGDSDQVGAVVIRDDFHLFRQRAVVQLFDLLVNAFERRPGFFAFAHQDHALHDVRVVIAPDTAQRLLRANADLTELFDVNRRPVAFGDLDIADVLGVPEQSDTAHVVALLAEFQIVRADVGVAVGYRLHHLRHGDAEQNQLVRIKLDVELFGMAAETDHVNHARNLFELALQHPILRRFQIHQRITVATEFVAIDFADGGFR
ncbi:MAG: hypothetical protein JMDDDDMK_03568 [Acidobacteria bacterium]|nr:hypothetical protein [Acidobacteriota bacterium]